jgi:hypothetical protein
MKKLVDKVSNIISSIFFSIYFIFLIPSYLLNNVSNIYEFIINRLKELVSQVATEPQSRHSKESLKKSIETSKELQKFLNIEVFKYYELLEGYDGYFTSIIKSLMKNIFIEDSPKLNAIRERLRKEFNEPFDSYKKEDNINITSCSYAMSITIYLLFLGIVYLLLSSLLSDSPSIVTIIFIIITIITFYEQIT